ncbi:MAG: ABC transporter substrate-binding protein [Lamprobacter sp.]|uniref:ABC transporter substrate-binding protein n=1 Tax=Lamprobacter sp. TaxID=3100796 RepID=UPI002B25B4B5|nr:ABC transporter substrate-binding protein [Lamprobacter sp.]MEA3640425.1 ABC transporter substrate-binding protein [Lamprobacter sp.]
MKASRPVAIGIAALGLILLIAGPLIPGGERLVRNTPPNSGHITDLGRADDGSILAGTQEGELWRYAKDRWAPVNVDLGGHPVTALSADLSGDASKGPIGTSGGLYNAPDGMPELPAPVRDEILASDRLLVATGKGLYVQGDGQWLEALEGTSLYRLETQQLGDELWLHIGTVGEGVYSARAADPLNWQPNREGLPAGLNVFSFVMTDGGRLIAGSDKGLFWQQAPMQPWQRLKVGLENSRMLSLYLEPAKPNQAERLWIGSDDGLWRLEINAADSAPEAKSFAELIQAPPGHVQYGVSWILPFGDGVMLSAGSVYQFGPMGLKGWYWISLAGLVLLLVGGWLTPSRNDADTPKTA